MREGGDPGRGTVTSGARALDPDELTQLGVRLIEAVRTGDLGGAEAAGLRLFETLVEHLGAERPALLRVAPAEADFVLREHQRVMTRLVELTITLVAAAERPPGAAGGSGGRVPVAHPGGAETPGCTCLAQAQELLGHLALQAEEERALRRAAC